MTVLLSFEEKTDDAHACAYSGRCPFNCFEHKLIRGSNLTSGLTLRAPLAIISMTLFTFKGDIKKKNVTKRTF